MSLFWAGRPGNDRPLYPGESEAADPFARGVTRWRPITAVRISGPRHSWLCDGLLDTGADDTVFDEDIAALIDVDLTHAPTREVLLAGRRQPLTCRYASVELRVTDGRETYEWNAYVGFLHGRLPYALLGHAGFLQFFDVEFRGSARDAVMVPNGSFHGRRS